MLLAYYEMCHPQCWLQISITNTYKKTSRTSVQICLCMLCLASHAILSRGIKYAHPYALSLSVMQFCVSLPNTVNKQRHNLNTRAGPAAIAGMQVACVESNVQQYPLGK